MGAGLVLGAPLMPPTLVPTVDTGLMEAKRDSRKAGARIQAQRRRTRGASGPEGSGFELEPGGGRRPRGGSREPVAGQKPPSPSWVHTALSLKPEPRSPCVPSPESAPRVAAPSRLPCPTLPCILCGRDASWCEAGPQPRHHMSPLGSDLCPVEEVCFILLFS